MEKLNKNLQTELHLGIQGAEQITRQTKNEIELVTRGMLALVQTLGQQILIDRQRRHCLSFIILRYFVIKIIT